MSTFPRRAGLVGTRVRSLVLALVLLASAGAAPLAPAAAVPAVAAADTGLRDGHGIHVVSAESDGSRLVRVVVSTKALSRPVRVNVLLPDGYDDTTRRYPAAYLFHGTSGGADDWLDSGDVLTTTAAAPLITVMPDAGYDSNGGSWFTNWVDQSTTLGAARWETFHVDQLIPWIDDNFRTVPHRWGRAVAGLSQGGFGAFSYAARHPDLFVAAGSFSGAPDIARNPAAKSAGVAVVGATMSGLNGVQPDAPFGDPVVDDLNWRGHNPASLVTNLRRTDLRLWGGNGEPGPYDDPTSTNGTSSAIERLTYQSTVFFAGYADAAGVRYVFHDYGPGTHTWPYWSRDLREWLPHVERVFAAHRTAPRVIGYRSVEQRWHQWGWRVAVHRDARWDWSRLARASRQGFTWTGGPARIKTPRTYRPGKRYVVAWAGHRQSVVAGEQGRLRVRIEQPGRVRVHVDRARRSAS